MPPVAVGNSCSWYIDPFSALAGGFGGTIQASYPVRIVISSMTAFYSWANPTGNGVYRSGDCVGSSNSFVALSYVVSYTFQVNLSASGQYVVLLINESQNYVHVQVILYSSVTSTFTTTSG